MKLEVQSNIFMNYLKTYPLLTLLSKYENFTLNHDFISKYNYENKEKV